MTKKKEKLEFTDIYTLFKIKITWLNFALTNLKYAKNLK